MRFGIRGSMPMRPEIEKNFKTLLVHFAGS